MPPFRFDSEQAANRTGARFGAAVLIFNVNIVFPANTVSLREPEFSYLPIIAAVNYY